MFAIPGTCLVNKDFDKISPLKCGNHPQSPDPYPNSGFGLALVEVCALRVLLLLLEEKEQDDDEEDNDDDDDDDVERGS